MAAERKVRPASSSPWRDVRPGFLIAGCIALLAFGIISGAAFDVATRPAPNTPRRAEVLPQPSRQFQPPRLPQVFPRETRSSILDSSQRKSSRAWAVDGTAPFVAFAVPAAASGKRPVVAIVIDDMGLDRPRSLQVMELTGPLTLSLMTYAGGLPNWVTQARSGGHEVMAHVPMEPLDAKENPGPGALMVTMDDVAIRRVLNTDLDGWQGYVGVNNHMGSKFTMDRPHMDVVMNELKARGLMWLDSKTTGESVGPAAARMAGVPFVERDVFLDNVETAEAVMTQLARLETLAKSYGSAIAIGHPHDATITALKQWLPQLAARGISLVPITEILKRRTSLGNRAERPS